MMKGGCLKNEEAEEDSNQRYFLCVNPMPCDTLNFPFVNSRISQSKKEGDDKRMKALSEGQIRSLAYHLTQRINSIADYKTDPEETLKSIEHFIKEWVEEVAR